jgi:hypothetical protein
MRFWLWRAPLAALLAVGLVVGTLSAQDWVGTPSAPGVVVAPAPEPGATPDGKWFPYGPVEIDASTPPRPRRPVGDFLRKCDVCCYANLHSFGCSNLKTELTYIFGSCRDFYAEPCVPPPPHYPGQPGYGHAGCDCGR